MPGRPEFGPGNFLCAEINFKSIFNLLTKTPLFIHNLVRDFKQL